MSNTLKTLLLERVIGGLQRKSLTQPSKWAQSVRIMSRPYPGPWTFRYHPWLCEMHDSKAEMNVGQKGAQLGFTEAVLNITFFKIDVENVDCLYVLPAKTPDAGDFSASRFDGALELSPHLSKLFSDVKNIGHKRAGSTNFYIRGSKSRAGLKSIPAGLIVLDEVDEMVQENIKLAFERTSGQKEKMFWLVSTPTIENYGINYYYNQSTREHFFFSCPSCSRYTELIFPECLQITGESLEDPNLENSYLVCKECRNKLDHYTKSEWLSTGKWIPDNTSSKIRGFHVNQLYAPNVTPCAIARSYLEGLRDPAGEQIFYNDKMGVPHTVSGAKLTDQIIESCFGNYLNGIETELNSNRNNKLVTMGVDVGTWLHVEVCEWKLNNQYSTDINDNAECRTIYITKVKYFNDLDELMRRFRVMTCVIDAMPERRFSYEFASRFWGHVKMCFYGRGIHSKQINKTKNENISYDEPSITVDRTCWLDLSLGRFRNSTIKIPGNTPFEYRDHLKSLTRIYEKDKEGHAYGVYRKAENIQDHYAHARNYAEIALPFAAHLCSPQNIKSPI